MARKHYWQFLVTDEGVPVENAQISIYAAGTEDPLWIYTDELSTNGTAVAPQTNSSLKGYFEFWIADETDASHGIPLSTKIKIAWSAAGVSDGYIDYVDVFSTFIEEVDPDSNDPLKNKAVSNELAKGWEDHRLALFPDENVHGIGTVDVSFDDDNLNKLVSNYKGKTWDVHARTMWDGSVSTATTPAYPLASHGIQTVDETDAASADKNKLVSNQLANLWNDHANNVPVDPHPQYMAADGSDDFTSPVGYINGTVVNSATANDFITKAYVDGHRYEEYVLATSYDLYSPGVYSKDIVHNLGSERPVVQVWDADSKFVIVPQGIEAVNTTTVRVYFNNNFLNVWVKVIK